MKKKLMMAAVLLGALTLGACVDDNESQSVTDVRNAKAEQLKSIAAMNNAEAQAKITLANADAAIKTAEAAQKQALADKAAAEAKIKELELKMAEATYDAALAAQLAQAQADKKEAEYQLAESQGKIDKLVISLEKDLAVLQKNLLQAQLDLKDKQDAVADAQLKDMKELANRYARVLSAYTTKSQAAINQKANIAAYEAELKDWEVLKASQISAKEFSISIYEKQIAALKEYSNYTEDVNALKLKLEDANSVLKVATDKYAALNGAYNDIDIDELKEAKNVPDLRVAVEENLLYGMMTGYSYIQGVNFYDYLPGTPQWKGDEIEKGDFVYPIYAAEFLELELKYKDVRTLKVEVDNRVAAIDVKGQKETIDKADVGLKALYDAAVEATATAKIAYDAAPTDAAKKAAYEDALDAEKTAETNLNAAEEVLAEREDQVAELNAAYALVSDTKKGDELLAAVKAYNDAVMAVYTEKANAFFAKEEAGVVQADAQIAHQTINAMVYGKKTGNGQYYTINLWDLYMGNISNSILGDNVNYSYSWGNADYNILVNTFVEFYAYTPADSDIDGAATIDSEIKRLEGEIEKAKGDIADLKDTTSQEQLIEREKATADGLQAQADALKVKMDALKVRLDAAIKAATPAE